MATPRLRRGFNYPDYDSADALDSDSDPGLPSAIDEQGTRPLPPHPTHANEERQSNPRSSPASPPRTAPRPRSSATPSPRSWPSRPPRSSPCPTGAGARRRGRRSRWPRFRHRRWCCCSRRIRLLPAPALRTGGMARATACRCGEARAGRSTGGRGLGCRCCGGGCRG